MTDYVTDRDQIEMVKRWWNHYGKIILIAVIIGLIVGFGWRYWRQHQIKEATAASTLYQAMALAIKNNNEKDALQYANQLMTKYSNTPYAALAAFFWASDAVSHQNYALANQKLQWVMQNSKIASFKQIALLRSARILIAENKPIAALTTLKKVDDKNFQPLIDQVSGDAYSAEGKVQEAKKAYNAASVGLLEMGTTDPILQMKLTAPVLEDYSAHQ